ncbi:MAG TPA: multiheme c-type cytochrome [Pirellulales bacterium]|nr:multiheme c-type cytochrome [Pirellulales bacterium]
MMANRNWWMVGLSALAVGMASGSLRATGQTPPTLLEPSIAYVGVSSCASVACHGGPNTSPSKWQSSYTVWVTKDRHAKAYSVLWEPRSKDIVRLLGGVNSPQPPVPWKDARCLACHSLTGMTADLSIASDGVSCEACHGAASHWLVPHTTAAWGKLASDKKYAARFGMQNTKDLIPRAEVCIGCHIGQAGSRDESRGDVTHEMIAAGHPRLAFEFSAYMANMPAHWNPAAHAAKREASAWVVGQALSAEAAKQLRATHAARGSVEFADYDCFACHHDLQSESWRQIDSDADRDLRSAPGELRLGTWYTGMIGQVQALSKLDLQSSTAPESAEALEAWINGQDAQELRQVMADVATQGAQALHWDDATQYYLGLLALDNARRDDLKAPDGEPSENDKRIRERIKLLNQELSFPKNLNSPRNYDPKQFRAELGYLSDLLTGKNN